MTATNTSRKHPRDRIITHHAELAKRAFAEHRLETRLDHGLYRSWRCGRPDSSVYAFTVTTTPGQLFVTGDIGELIVSRTSDMIAWSRGAIRSIEYFAEKVPHAIPTKEYDPAVAQRWCDEFLADEDNGEDKKLSLTLLLDDAGVDEQERFCLSLYDSGIVDGCDFPDFKNWNSNFLWCREAVMWLLERIPAPEPKEREA